MGSEVLAAAMSTVMAYFCSGCSQGRGLLMNMFKEGLDLHKFANAALPEKVVAFVGQEMKKIQRTRTDSSHMFQGSLTSIMEIGAACSA
ncbi:hypothetical protein NC651_019114 [Populus alba x Populus x berolinensis]|nr:hypothetical protein NC651_019114 [Populus alba x Populus x berolinensis]